TNGVTAESCPEHARPSNEDRTGIRFRTPSVPVDAGRTIRFGRCHPTAAATWRCPMSTILIVANQTLPSQDLATEVTRRIASGSRDFHVVVPATPPPGSGFTWDEEAARTAAEERLEAFKKRLADQGATAEGEIGDRDPVQAARDAARGRDVFEIILSTLPTGARIDRAPMGTRRPDQPARAAAAHGLARRRRAAAVRRSSGPE